MAFEEHVKNASLGKSLLHPVWYQQPGFYFTNPAAVIGPRQDVPMVPGTTRFDYEREIGAVIGTPGSDLSPEQAEACIAGHLISADWSARDLQQQEMQLRLGPARARIRLPRSGRCW
jgi:2-keto-4-pentenoate hydratase/2-oxohepta-3-ene-1,7-dioic acid hydratase in catechol pathway